MDKVFLVGIGGAVGSILRYLISTYIQDASHTSAFPYGTLAVNVVGCFVIGIFSYLADVRGVLTPELRALFVVGVLGGFTTFSSFGNETLTLVRDGLTLNAVGYVAASLVLGLGAVWVGRSASALVLK